MGKCNHGGVSYPEGHPGRDFANKFLNEMIHEDDGMKALKNTYEWENHHEVWNDAMMRKMVIDELLSVGTDDLLENYTTHAREFAKAITILEACSGEGTTFCSAMSSRLEKLGYLKGAGDRDVVRFYKKRLSCLCLEEKYSLLKESQDRVSECFHCKQITKGKKLKICIRCKHAHYCSMECHELDWPTHKKDCRKMCREVCSEESQEGRFYDPLKHLVDNLSVQHPSSPPMSSLRDPTSLRDPSNFTSAAM
eukprot:CAMPEP_0178950682 /NCGR_PEP_ID=MMETSP0789-20121207/6788_1 /TAXON_ID=3005 /ORGANISM="Rhizosolenia setigera, Strain CCMP 1694" /LENGTH=250 /DNA_ID=CAMNT_0020631435 /DNA_START=126 /DNA_END=875 /DNA_ORIENTATION=-